MELRFLLLTLPQGFPHPVKDRLGELKFPENLLKLALQLFLPYIESPAGAFVEGAVVVDVAILLDLGGDGAAAAGALQKAGIGEAVSRGPRIVSLGDDRLHAVKKPLVDQGRVLAVVALSAPEEVPDVEGVLQNLGYRASAHPVAPAGGQALPGGLHFKPAHRILARGVLLEHLLDDRGALRVDLDGLLNRVMPVAQRRAGASAFSSSPLRVSSERLSM